MRRRIILCSVIVTLFLSVFMLFQYKPDYLFLVQDMVNRLFLHVDVVELTIPKKQLRDITVEDIKNKQTDIEYDYHLLLINEAHRIPMDQEFIIVPYGDGDVYMLDSMVEAYENLCRFVTEETKEQLLVSSSYRSRQDQERVYQEETAVAAVPGSSEHQIGLALDLYVEQYSGSAFLKTKSGQLVNQDCWEYGFIIRYPFLKEEETGICYEPWHIRYVGCPHAEVMYKNSLTLEEYIDSLQIGEFYRVGNYVISRQTGETLHIPAHLKNVKVSPDNMGNHIVTGEFEL